jgi:type III restriction enzyme
MNRHVNAIAARLSLRPPQRRSLEILDRVTEIVGLGKDVDRDTALAAIRSEYPTLTDFERDFISLCFALATGVGKTRLIGAFISYLYLAHGFHNFFVLAPNLTIYNKLITDFTENTPKYVFQGIGEFATNPPAIITGDNYEGGRGVRKGQLFEAEVHINIFNISKINSEVRGGKSPRIKRLCEYIGQSYFDYLAELKDLVLIMDESHRYRASAGVRAINELRPTLGLEVTATPFVETSRGPIAFKNVVYDYPLARAMADGFVKEPAVVTQKNFDPSQFSPEELERIKLQDGVRLHENVKVELETYARQTGQQIVKPFLLVIARDTTHASQLLQHIQSEKFFEGRYKDKVIQVDSSKTGAEEEEMIRRLLAVESAGEPTEIVIHVNMLKEGWDVTNLYTIVPLRAANARTLIEQSIGRGLRLPYGKRTGVTAVDRLSIVAHDKFQEIVDEASRSDSPIRLQQLILDPSIDLGKTVAVVSQATLVEKLGGQSLTANTPLSQPPQTVMAKLVFETELERKVAQVAYEVIKKHESLPTSGHLLKQEVQSQLVQEVKESLGTYQLELPGLAATPDIVSIVEKTATLVVQQTIDIPRILVVPTGEVTTGFDAFTLDLSSVHYQPSEHDILIQNLRTHEQQTLYLAGHVGEETRLEDYLVRSLIDFDDVCYDEHADLVYDLAGQVVRHLRSYLSEENTHKVLKYQRKPLADLVHSQMVEHHWERAAGYEVVVRKGFTELKPCAYTATADNPIRDFRETVTEKSKIAQILFGGFSRCLYPVQKFQSDTERKLAIILDRESQKWFKPALGQFQIFYKSGLDQREYQPDFVAETADGIHMLEPKREDQMNEREMLAKRDAAVQWCQHASDHAVSHGGKRWSYAMIPHDAVAGNMTLERLATQFACAPGSGVR